MAEKEKFSNDYTDPLFKDIVKYIAEVQQVSAGLIQRRFTVGYLRAENILKQLEAAGLIGPKEEKKKREIYITPEIYQMAFKERLGADRNSAECEDSAGIPGLVVTGREFVRILRKEISVDIRLFGGACVLLEKGNIFEFFFKKDLYVRAIVLTKTVANRLEDFPEEIFVKAGLDDFHMTERYNYIYQKFTPEEVEKNQLVAIEFEIIP